ncbi:hypothetical protein VTL71DRAFT_16296 [Oculimacula yallundae]|uniref:Uncharacterized protein n=1 Tax=Oculimacula yallundae TaxID=86028 RepID=A0ABR4CGC3_9HELO
MVDHHRFGRSSFLLASHDIAHREHTHKHHLLHRAGEDSSVVGAIVTEVVATVSVIQQVTVDTNGITLGQNTFTADSTGGTSFPPTTTESATPSTISASPPGSSSLGSTASSTAGSGLGDQAGNAAASASGSASQSLLSIQNTASAATPSSIPTTFASILANSTSVISVSSATSLTQNFFNSSTSSLIFSGSSSSSASLLSSSTIFDDSSTSSFSSTSSLYSPSSSSPTPTPTNGIVGGGGTGTGSGDPSADTAAADSGNSSSAPSTSTVVGGVVGGVAGAAILIFLIMFLIRWKRRNSSMLALGNGEGEGEGTADTSRGVPPSQPPGGMAERSSFGAFAVPAALASLTGYKRNSQRTADRTTISSTAGSERGFYRVSGRKLPSVLQSGGDGYGGGVMESNTLSGSSFYRDSQGFYGGVGSPTSPGLAVARDSGVPIMREGPARTPVTEQGPFADPPVSLPPPRRPDVVGRSHPSFDGSQRSRFTEEV